MKLFSLRSLLILAVALAIVANILWRMPSGSSAKPASADSMSTAEIWAPENILPSVSNLRAMGKQWEARLATLPPEERAKSEARLKEETRFFVEAQFLPREERKAKVRERIETLMNDPGIQSDWAAERMKMLAGMTPEQRHEVLKKYVQSKDKQKQSQ
ncbi:MAG: hypothetical protein D4R65_00425 [Verrucomicrobiaceae bacterium]|nr:MAG: hypothetical protein D4R65_00425 [Verrucomicrobiaceae bacterium]